MINPPPPPPTLRMRELLALEKTTETLDSNHKGSPGFPEISAPLQPRLSATLGTGRFPSSTKGRREPGGAARSKKNSPHPTPLPAVGSRRSCCAGSTPGSAWHGSARLGTAWLWVQVEVAPAVPPKARGVIFNA